MSALDTVIRLARDEVARESRVLRELNGTIAEVDARIDALRDEADAERRSATGLAENDALLAAYLDANRQRRSRLTTERLDLERERDAQSVRVRERRLEQKRIEVLRERRAADALRAERERERRELEDLVAARLPRSR